MDLSLQVPDSSLSEEKLHEISLTVRLAVRGLTHGMIYSVAYHFLTANSLS